MNAYLIAWALLMTLVAGFVIFGGKEPVDPPADPAPLLWPCEITNCDREADPITHKGRWICRDCKAEIDAHRARIVRKH